LNSLLPSCTGRPSRLLRLSELKNVTVSFELPPAVFILCYLFSRKIGTPDKVPLGVSLSIALVARRSLGNATAGE